MATLVLTAVGTALGGPVGGAIGSLLGQAFDQQLLGSANRGPRLGELAVQSSSYGTAIPRIYGTMRVAGSVVWATDLQESASQTGAKGQPDTTVYSYSVSFAVALSSRRAAQVKRIWADGKLLRGAAGDFKVSTGFRFYPGSEDQQPDPLIASIEGVGAAPAFRGLAVAVFEDLELAEYGNRIPFLTFELEGGPGPAGVAQILGDASEGAIDCSSAQTVTGYAAYGRSIRAAVEPLITSMGLELFDDGTGLRSPGEAEPLVVSGDQLGCSADGSAPPRVELAQAGATSVPASLSLSYHERARDYQTGQMRASAGDAPGGHVDVEFPAALEAGSAKALAEAMLAKRWAERDRLTLHLPPAFLAVTPGSTIKLEADAATAWTVAHVTINGLVAECTLRPAWSAAAAAAADPGRALPVADEVAATPLLALFDLPDLGGGAVAALQLAASSASGSWRSQAVEIRTAGSIISAQTAASKTILGAARTALGEGQPFLIDASASVEVELHDASQWIESCDDQALAAGLNLAVVGDELIQFGSALPTGSGRFRLSRLLRGRRGSEWAMAAHRAGEPFAMLNPATLRAIPLGEQLVGTTIEATLGGNPPVSRIFTAEALRPPSPVHLRAEAGATGILVSWVRRSRRGWIWADEMDAPLGESAERYRVTFAGAAGTVEIETQQAGCAIATPELAQLGPGPCSISVRQLGDAAVSRATTVSLTLD